MKLEIKVPSYALSYDKKRTKAIMRAAGSEVAAAIRALIRSKSGGGKRYGKHTASAPGSPPASLSGKLAASIRTRVRQRGNEITASIRDTEFYALFLEKGAAGGGRKGARNPRVRNVRVGVSGSRVLAPRPFMQKVLDAKRDSITQRIQQAVVEDIKFERKK